MNRNPVSHASVNSKLPPRCEEIIFKLLEKDRRRRYQSAAELEADLRQLKLISDALERTAGLPRVRSPLRKRWSFTIAISVVILLAIVVVVVFMSHQTPALAERDVVLLADFANTTKDAAFDDVLKKALAGQLKQSRFLNILGEDRIRELFGKLGQYYA